MVGEVPADVERHEHEAGDRDCRTECVVSRRSFERCMPPCSAIERSRLMTRHTVRYGASHKMKYTHGWPSAMPIAMNTSCVPTMARAWKRIDAVVGRARPRAVP